MRSTTHQTVLSLAAAFVAAASVACSSERPAPKTAVDTERIDVTQPTNATVPATPADQQVNVSPKLRAACNLSDAGHAPKFDFDQSALSGNDRDLLGEVATCLTTGPLAGHSVLLVGRADPRGEAEYNMNLGEHRASAVRDYLQQLGVTQARIHDTSRGALDATGHDEDTWRVDRRVDIDVEN